MASKEEYIARMQNATTIEEVKSISQSHIGDLDLGTGSAAVAAAGWKKSNELLGVNVPVPLLFQYQMRIDECTNNWEIGVFLDLAADDKELSTPDRAIITLCATVKRLTEGWDV